MESEVNTNDRNILNINENIEEETRETQNLQNEELIVPQARLDDLFDENSDEYDEITTNNVAEAINVLNQSIPDSANSIAINIRTDVNDQLINENETNAKQESHNSPLILNSSDINPNQIIESQTQNNDLPNVMISSNNNLEPIVESQNILSTQKDSEHEIDSVDPTNVSEIIIEHQRTSDGIGSIISDSNLQMEENILPLPLNISTDKEKRTENSDNHCEVRTERILVTDIAISSDIESECDEQNLEVISDPEHNINSEEMVEMPNESEVKISKENSLKRKISEANKKHSKSKNLNDEQVPNTSSAQTNPVIHPNDLKIKQKKKEIQFQSDVTTRQREADYIQSLDPINRAAYVTVKELRMLSSDEMRDPETHNIVRPCYSNVTNEVITQEDWSYYNRFSQHYINRQSKCPRILQCEFNTERIFYHQDDISEYETFKILAHTVDSENSVEFVLVQYLCIHSSYSNMLAFENRRKGEISWQRISNIFATNEHYIRYQRHKNANYMEFNSLDSFNSRKTLGRSNRTDQLPDLTTHLSNRLGKSVQRLNELLFERESLDCEKDFDIQYSLFNHLVQFIKENNLDSYISLFPKLIGKMSNNMSVQHKFNRNVIRHQLPAILSPSTAAKDIEKHFGEEKLVFGNKIPVITVLMSMNGIGFNSKDKHTSIGIFRKGIDSQLEYFYFDPSKNDSNYMTVCSTMRQIISNFRSDTKKFTDIRRSYGQQIKEKNCFIQCLRYVCLLMEGFDYEKNQIWSWDKDEKSEKIHKKFKKSN